MQTVLSLMNELVAAREAPGLAAAVFQGDRVVWSGASGRGDLAAGRPLTVDTKARVASVSKIATALALHQVAEEGKVDLDVDASAALGFALRHPAHPDSPITPRMVTCHTSGVRDGDGYQGVVGETLEGFLRAGGERWNDGEHWAKREAPIGYFAYSNLGMGILAQIVERATGERFDRAAKRMVFDPLGLTCGFNWSGVPDAEVAVASPLYRRPTAGGDWVVQVDGAVAAAPRPTVATKPGVALADYALGVNGLLFSPQGGLRASVLDLAKIGMALTGAVPLLDADTRADIARPQWLHDAATDNGDTSGGAFQGFGSGVHLLIPGEGCPIADVKARLIGHYGDAYGLLAGLWVDPASGAGFAWFANGSPQAPAKGERSGVYRIEERMMQALAEAAGLA